jgi:hypothetical protein
MIPYLIAWVSIERHITILHPTWLATKIKRIFFHYLPIVICIVYPCVFYLVELFTLPCNIPINYTKLHCNLYGCIYYNSVISTWDSVGNYMLRIFVITIFNIALILRVLYSRCRVRQRIQ